MAKWTITHFKKGKAEGDPQTVEADGPLGLGKYLQNYPPLSWTLSRPETLGGGY